MLRTLRRTRRIAGLTLAALLVAVFLVQAWYYARLLWWAHHAPATTAFMERRLEQMRARDPRARLQHRWVLHNAYCLKRAVVAMEDARFLVRGLDWSHPEALEERAPRGRGLAISQQLAGCSVGGAPWWRKGGRRSSAMLEV
jgi:monofunctional biosynthetic peptidoglycan transglycosylase